MNSHMFDQNFVCQNCKLECPGNQICMKDENVSLEDTLEDKIDREDEIENGTKNHDGDKSLQETQDLLLQIDSIKIVLMSKNSVQIKITPNQKEVQIVML